MKITIGQIIKNRFRDLDSIFRADKKFNIAIYVFLRIFIKIFSIPESKISRLIKENNINLYGFKFHTREKTLDFIHLSKLYEPETTNYLINISGNTLIIVGGHIGRFALIGSSNFNKVLIYEPEPSNNLILNKNIATNSIKNCIVQQLALSNVKGTGQMVSSVESNTGAAYLVNRIGDVQVALNRLDDSLNDLNISNGDVDLLLIDAEEHEMFVLEGSNFFLQNTKATLIIECFDPKDLIPFLKKYGYTNTGVLDHRNFVFQKSHIE